MGTEIKINTKLPPHPPCHPRFSQETVPSRKGLSSSAKHVLPPWFVFGVQRGLQLSAVKSLVRSPRCGSTLQFLLLSLLTNLKGTLGFCMQHGLYRAGQEKLLLTKSRVENGTAAHSIITPGTWVWRMLSLLTVITILLCFPTFRHKTATLHKRKTEMEKRGHQVRA